MANNNKIVAVLLSGGAGARLWPVSREALPKLFLKLPDGDSLLQKTVGRVLTAHQVLTVTNRDYYFLAREVQVGSYVGEDMYGRVSSTGAV